jgi:hypothetical protein
MNEKQTRSTGNLCLTRRKHAAPSPGKGMPEIDGETDGVRYRIARRLATL